MQSRYACSTLKAGDESESWSESSSVGTMPTAAVSTHGLSSPLHPQHSYHHHHHHHHRQREAGSSPAQLSLPLQMAPTSEYHLHHQHQHHHYHHPRSQEEHKPHAGSAKLHSSALKNNLLLPLKTLGIGSYYTENLLMGRRTGNCRGAVQPGSELPTFQRRCIHAIADMIASPYTVLPALVGVFLRPDGTKKNTFNKQLSDYLKVAYRRIAKKPKGLQHKSDIPATLLPTVLALLFSYVCGLIFGWQLGLTIGLASTLLYLIFICLVLYGGLARHWKLAQRLTETLLRYTRSWHLIVDILFYTPPEQSAFSLNVRLLPVSLKFGESETSWDAIVRLSEKMWEAATLKYSKSAVYLQYAIEDVSCQRKHQCRKVCCLPTFVCFGMCIVSLLCCFTALQIYLKSEKTSGQYKSSSEVTFIVSGAVALLSCTTLFATTFKPLLRLIGLHRRFHSLRKESNRLHDCTLEHKGGSKVSGFFVKKDDDDEGEEEEERSCSPIGSAPRESTLQQTPLHDVAGWLEKGERTESRLEVQLQQENMATCRVLHRLDARIDRQTRFFLSIDVTAYSTSTCSSSSPLQPHRLTEFCHLLRRIFTSSPRIETGLLRYGGNPPQDSQTKDEAMLENLAETEPNLPNIFILLVCRQDLSPPLATSRQESERVYDYWQQTLDACHLTVFIDEPTEGAQQLQDASGLDCLSESILPAETNQCVDSKSSIEASSMPLLSFHEFFIKEHPLAELNYAKLKHLLTHMAFLGRMLRTGECQSVWTSLLEVATIWLCVLVHWPFHAAWLSLFLEEHYSRRQRRVLPGCATATEAEVEVAREGLSSSEEDEDDFTTSNNSQPVLPGDTLSMLYSRVLERLAPALSACRPRGPVSSPASHCSQTALPGSWGGGHRGTALRLYELAAYDCDSERLAALLHHSIEPRTSLDSHSHTAFSNNPVTTSTASVCHLVAVMAASPLVNPRTKALIQAFLNRRGFSLVRSNSRDLHLRRSLQSLRDREFDLPQTSAHTSKTSPCPIRLQNGLPREKLSKMTVDDICKLVDNMSDLCRNHCQHRSSINSSFNTLEDRQSSSQSISRPAFIAAYLLRLRALNISGAVLTVCSMNESLRREIGMTVADWQLFSSLITYLKHLEGNKLSSPSRPPHSCHCARSMGDLASIHSQWSNSHAGQHEASANCRINTGTWTSESILAAATMQRIWHHPDDSFPSPTKGRSNRGVGNTNSTSDSASCSSVSEHWHESQTHPPLPLQRHLVVEEEACRLSGGSFSIYSAELSYSLSPSSSTAPSHSPSPSISSSTVYDETAQRKTMPPGRHWQYGVNA